MTLGIMYAATVTALLALVLFGYVADLLHSTHGEEPRRAVPRPRRPIGLRRVL